MSSDATHLLALALVWVREVGGNLDFVPIATSVIGVK